VGDPMTITLNGTTGITTPALDSVAPFSSADMPAGSVLQVVIAEDSTILSLATSTYTDTGLSASITPTATSSKILVMWNVQCDHASSDSGEVARLQAEYDNNAYQRQRAKAYPSIQEQLDMQYWDGVNGTTIWADTVASVKAENPKP
jgi:hypothetical protein